VGASSFGTGSVAGADSSVAVGRDSSAPATDSATYGARSIAEGKASTAVGTESDARGASSLALGSGARATKKGAVALGSGSVGDIADAVSVGHKNHERRVINVATAVDPTDAVNLKQVKALIKAAGLSGTMMSTLRVPISGLPVSGPAHGAKLDTVAMLHSGSGTQAGAEPASGHNRPVTGRSEDIEPSTVVGWAKMKHDGSLVASRNVVGHARQGIGVYEIAFKTQSLAQCVYNATLHGAGLVSVNEGSLPNSLKVETRNHLGIPADLAFHLTATC
jgi:autotransporter adhesin